MVGYPGFEPRTPRCEALPDHHLKAAQTLELKGTCGTLAGVLRSRESHPRALAGNRKRRVARKAWTIHGPYAGP
jgi:hypothetical protein